MRRSVVSAALLASLASPATAQRLAAVWVPASPAFATAPASPRTQKPDPADHDVGRAVGGVIGAAAGFFAGAFLGAAIEKGSGSCGFDDLCGLTGAVYGGTLGEGLGMVAGMAASGRGSRPVDLLISTGIAVAGLAAGLAFHAGYVLIAVPIVQIGVLLSADDRAAATALPPAAN